MGRFCFHDSKRDDDKQLPMDPAIVNALPSLGTFDFLVVGAGPSAAGLLKALLGGSSSAAAAETTTKNDDDDDPMNPPFTVAVLEQGGADPPRRAMDQWFTASQKDAPHILATVLVHQERHHPQRVYPVPLATGLGGTTRINAGLVVPPTADDFDAVPCITNRTEGMNAVHVILQSLPIQHSPPPTAAAAMRSTKIPRTPLAGWNEMTYPSVCTTVPCCVDGNGQRVTYFEALVPTNDDEATTNLHLFLHYQVERIEQADTTNNNNNYRTLIVRHVITDRLFRIHARRDIILCAGTVETPALLVASGLLNNTDIAPLVDHQLLPMVYIHWPRLYTSWRNNSNNHHSTTNVTGTTNGVSALGHYITKTTGARIQVAIHEGSILIDLVPYLVAALTWYRAHPGPFWHSIGLSVIQFIVGYTPLYYLLRYCITVRTIFLMNPHSQGTVSVVPKQQSQQQQQQSGQSLLSPMYRSDYDVTIDLRYLSDERDLDQFAEAWHHDQQACCGLVMDDDCVEVFPRRLAFSRTFARFFVLPYFHWMGTCSRHIGPDWRFICPHKATASSSSSSLSVRICDASILPGLSAPTALTCAALGYVLGNRLKKELFDEQQVK
jgi:choline dehydrogenase-like flavoprotein